MRLSTHFDLQELIVSETAARQGIDNTPGPQVLENLHTLASTLEAVRARLGKPILISSGYRSVELNTVIGGSRTSAHMRGLAADFICPGYGTPLEICQSIASMDVPFDQLINEFSRWVHLGLPMDGEPYRRELLTARRNGRTVYVPGLHEVGELT